MTNSPSNSTEDITRYCYAQKEHKGVSYLANLSSNNSGQEEDIAVLILKMEVFEMSNQRLNYQLIIEKNTAKTMNGSFHDGESYIRVKWTGLEPGKKKFLSIPPLSNEERAFVRLMIPDCPYLK